MVNLGTLSAFKAYNTSNLSSQTALSHEFGHSPRSDWNSPSESFTPSRPEPLTIEQGRNLQNSVETAIHNRAHNRISHLQLSELSEKPVTLQELVDPHTAQAARARQTIQLADQYLAQAHNHNNSKKYVQWFRNLN